MSMSPAACKALASSLPGGGGREERRAEAGSGGLLAAVVALVPAGPEGPGPLRAAGLDAPKACNKEREREAGHAFALVLGASMT